MEKLTPRQQKFVDAYDGNATAAARAAGYTGDDPTLGVTGSRLLKLARVKAAIAARHGQESRALIATRQERQAFWTKVMSGVAPTRLKDGTVVDMPVDMKDRLKASELLGKSEADFTEKLAGADGGPLKVTFHINRSRK